jgi:hypothetical protein
MAEFTNYYVNQAGTGITGYSGIRYQKGHGFFGKIFSSAVLPILKYLGKKALSTGVSIGADVLQGENLKKTMKKRIKSTGLDIAEDALEKLRNYKQTGSGKRRKTSYKAKALKTRKRKRKSSVLQLRALAKGQKLLSLKGRKILNFHQFSKDVYCK